jgi:transcriptional regulator with XRE-family HTH domain
MTTIESRLGQRIARQRRAMGLTQAQLADKVDVEPETISRIETGARSASLALLVLVARALEVKLDELFRLHDRVDVKDQAVERLLWFAARLSSAEIELVMDVGAAVVTHARREKPV